jgi:hypothetical protein
VLLRGVCRGGGGVRGLECASWEGKRLCGLRECANIAEKGMRGLRGFCDTNCWFQGMALRENVERTAVGVLGAKTGTGRSRSGLPGVRLGLGRCWSATAGTICTKSLDRSTRALPREKRQGGEVGGER